MLLCLGMRLKLTKMNDYEQTFIKIFIDKYGRMWAFFLWRAKKRNVFDLNRLRYSHLIIEANSSIHVWLPSLDLEVNFMWQTDCTLVEPSKICLLCAKLESSVRNRSLCAINRASHSSRPCGNARITEAESEVPTLERHSPTCSAPAMNVAGTRGRSWFSAQSLKAVPYRAGRWLSGDRV